MSCITRVTRRPGIYSRAFLEGRLTEKQLDNFRRELEPRAAGCPRIRIRG